ncbi:unnamed protein product [Owenia fusiformis]|uniref:Nitric oxide synthase n=1 Tax=Owenia fusiformis TaxID=6347 RepID=A0A8J1U8Z1_OWEFU|nr:unnamed protein product [Owenia fusiformis]
MENRNDRSKFEKAPLNTVVRLNNVADGTQIEDTLYRSATRSTHCKGQRCVGSKMFHTADMRKPSQMHPKHKVKELAEDFLKQYYAHLNKLNSEEHLARLNSVTTNIEKTGYYEHTFDELQFGARTAWRNAPRCVNRIFWNELQLLDGRKCRSAKDMYKAACEHLVYGGNGGKIRSVVTMFPARHNGEYRVWNSQLIRYAGYRQPDGSVIGDPLNVEFTEICQRMGWVGSGGMFDVLPLILEANGEDPELFDIPKQFIHEVHIKHPEFTWFAELGLKWYAVPAVSNMMFDIGGLQYGAAPFNGWYMSAEVGRDLVDAARYNMSESVAVKMGLDTKSVTSLWKDKAVIEVNRAILYSFQEAKTKIVDHHTCTEGFIRHLKNEQRLRGGCPADWVWIVPPISGSLSPAFHQEMLNYHLTPSIEYQVEPWYVHKWKSPELRYKFRDYIQTRRYTVKHVASLALFCTSLLRKILKKRENISIIYATDSGKSERYAKIVGKVFANRFNTSVTCMNQKSVEELAGEKMVILVSSTAGDGDPPQNGKQMFDEMKMLSEANSGKLLDGVKYSVFALGSTAHIQYCKCGREFDNMLSKLGASRVHPRGEGDELYNEEDSFWSWLKPLFKKACDIFNVQRPVLESLEDVPILTQNYKLLTKTKSVGLVEGLSLLSKKNVVSTKISSRRFLSGKGALTRVIQVVFSVEGDNNNSDLSYSPGDHVAVFPQNTRGSIARILAKVDAETTMPLQVITGDGEEVMPVCTIKEALQSYLDIATAMSRENLKRLVKMEMSDKDRQKIANLIEDNSTPCTHTLGDLTVMCPSMRLDATFLMTSLPRLQPRVYSISNVQEQHPNEIHVTATIVEYRSQDGVIHNGVCTSWFENAPLGSLAPMYIKKALHFNLPNNPRIPVVLIATGSGIAPFRSFWQKRVAMMKGIDRTAFTSDMTLFYGCRTEADDMLYMNEINKAVEHGAMVPPLIAYSRDHSKPKNHVQDLIKKNAKLFFQKLIKQNGHVFVCGNIQMALSVKETIIGALSEAGGMSIAEAAEHTSKMKKSDRYHEDLFGISAWKSSPSSRVNSAQRMNGLSNGHISKQNGMNGLKKTVSSKSLDKSKKHQRFLLCPWSI